MTQEVPADPTLLGREFASAMVNFHAATGKLLGLSAVERKCMDTLRILGPVPAGTIAEHTGLTTGAVTGLVDRLEKAGYAKRTRDPLDRRKVRVELVPNERVDELLAEVFVPFGTEMAELMTRYSPAELQAIRDWIDRTTDILVRNTQRISDPDFKPASAH
ncbi:MarR family transcriptional regulator [Nocardia sp. NPDC051756]|uniref:MarR family winged helix-turn-helix transcriptional regulator n=1 Tax=Nocardia sp. NPDC051756 TaxID=3154751 RepID=UPI0034165CED